MLTRRQFLASASLTSAAIASSYPSLSHSSNNSEGPLATMHNDVIDKVKQLVGNQQIQLTLLYPKGCLANLKPITEVFSKETGVTFSLKETGVDEINSTIIFNSAKNEYLFDIALPATFGLPDLVSAGALAPLSNYVEQYEPSDYKTNQLYDYGDYINGTFYGYQTDGDTYLMFYNKTMMDSAANKEAFKQQYGYDLAIPTTWEQLDDMIQFFHQPEKNQYGGSLFRVPGYGAWEWWSRFHAKGYFPMDNKGDPQINNQAGIAALQAMLDVSAYLHPNTASDNLFDNWNTFGQNQTFCNIGWGGSQKYFNSQQSKVKNNLYYASTPGGNIKGETISCPIFNWGWNYVVSTQCPQKELAYLFTLYACSPAISTLAVQQDGYFDPFREEHYANEEIKTIYSPEFLDAHRNSMTNSIPDFYLQNQSAYLSSLQENIYLAYKGSLSAKQALDITATDWKLQTAKVGKDIQKKNWLELRKKYPSTLRNRLI